MTAVACAHCADLAQQLADAQAENARLREALNRQQSGANDATKQASEHEADKNPWSPLSRPEMQRYSRQMLVPDVGIARQLKLRHARVLIVGAGGLGCPAALYLGGMGVGGIGLVDDDRVERSNLHRQIGHDESTVGQLKVESLARRVRSLNPDVMVETYAARFTAFNAEELICNYDLVLDASDNPATRYLLNDVCAKQCKPLVSGSALGLEGQVTVFTYADGSACYRCLYPTPPRQPQSCAENGVLGIVPGIIGCLQALEAVKVLTSLGAPLSGTQVLFDAYDTQFRRLKFAHQRRADCPSCGTASSHSPSITMDDVCGQDDAVPVELGAAHRIDVAAFDRLRREPRGAYVLLDTRPMHQFDMVHFPEAINVPFDQLRRAHIKRELHAFVASKVPADHVARNDLKTLVICRRGVDSELVTSWLIACDWQNVRNVDGGYTRYANSVDPNFPMY